VIVQNNLRVVQFINDYVHRDRRLPTYHLKIEDSEDKSKNPSLELLEEHFRMCLLRYFASPGPNLEFADTYKHSYAIHTSYRDPIDLSERCWSIPGGGKNALELYLAMRLFVAAPPFDSCDGDDRTRWPSGRFAEADGLRTPAEEDVLWPDNFDLMPVNPRRVIWDPKSGTWVKDDGSIQPTDPDHIGYINVEVRHSTPQTSMNSTMATASPFTGLLLT
jgi:hypothetical protein